jgi:prolyl-tRNA editing enzyme YbaK/EbsC (Cys-tRNA(Pro) deacylase)
MTTDEGVVRVRGSLNMMWPASVEEVAAVFRAAGVEARLEELASGEEDFPGQGVRADAFDCDGRVVVALVPVDRDTDPRKLRCVAAKETSAPRFPYPGAEVLLDSSLLGEQTVWLEAGSDRHVIGVSPAQLLRIVRAQTSDLVVEA